MTDTTLDSPEHLYVGPTGFRLAPSHLTLDDLEGVKNQRQRLQNFGTAYLVDRLRDWAEIL